MSASRKSEQAALHPFPTPPSTLHQNASLIWTREIEKSKIKRFKYLAPKSGILQCHRLGFIKYTNNIQMKSIVKCVKNENVHEPK